MSKVAVAVRAVDSDFTSRCVVERVGEGGLLGLTVQYAKAEAALG